MIAQLLFLYRICHEFAFVVIGHRTHEAYFFAFAIVGKQYFFNLPLVVADYLVGNVNDILGAAVVLFNFTTFTSS